MYLFFDTETTGLPKHWGAPVTDLNNWPRLVQLAFVLTDAAGSVLQQTDIIVKPDGYTIPVEASRIHRITQEKAEAEGIPLSDAVELFRDALVKSKYLVAHNISFDEKIMGCEFLRLGKDNPMPTRKGLCTMKESTNYCAIPGARGGYKWPKLQELHMRLFKTTFDEAHNAAADIGATVKCFFAMKEKHIAFTTNN